MGYSQCAAEGACVEKGGSKRGALRVYFRRVICGENLWKVV